MKQGQTFATLQGPAHSILGGERVALNFLQHLSGIATLTSRFLAAIRHYPTILVDTRKTIPGLRRLEKWAVALGGGTNHRMSLSDGVLIKDNHLVLLEAQGITLRETCRKAKERLSHHFRICVEVETLEQIDQALDGGADVLLLDNMSPSLVREAVGLIKGAARKPKSREALRSRTSENTPPRASILFQSEPSPIPHRRLISVWTCFLHSPDNVS